MSISFLGMVMALSGERETRDPEIMDALQHEPLGDNLIRLIRSDIHLDVGGGLQKFPYTG